MLPTAALSERSLVELSDYALLFLRLEREAGCRTLFGSLPSFAHEVELFNYQHWLSLQGVAKVPDIREMVDEIQKELREVVAQARLSQRPADYLEYAQELADQIKAAKELVEMIDAGCGL